MVEDTFTRSVRLSRVRSDIHVYDRKHRKLQQRMNTVVSIDGSVSESKV